MSAPANASWIARHALGDARQLAERLAEHDSAVVPVWTISPGASSAVAM